MRTLLFFMLLLSSITLRTQVDWSYRDGIRQQVFRGMDAAFLPDGSRIGYGTSSDSNRVLRSEFFVADAEGNWQNSFQPSIDIFPGSQSLFLSEGNEATYALAITLNDPAASFRVFEVSSTELISRHRLWESRLGVDWFRPSSFQIVSEHPLRYLITGDTKRAGNSELARSVFLLTEEEVLWERAFAGPVLFQNLEIKDVLDTTRTVLYAERGSQQIIIELDLSNGSTIRDGILNEDASFLDLRDVRYNESGQLFGGGMLVSTSEERRAFITDLSSELRVPNDQTRVLDDWTRVLKLTRNTDPEKMTALVGNFEDNSVGFVQFSEDLEDIFSETVHSEFLNPFAHVCAANNSGSFLFFDNPFESTPGKTKRLNLTEFRTGVSAVVTTEFQADYLYDDDAFVGIAPHPDGYLLSGYRARLGAEHDGWLQIIDPDGTVLRSQLTGLPGEDRYGPALATSDGNFLIQRFRTDPELASEIWIEKRNERLELIWEIAVPSDSEVYAEWREKSNGEIILVTTTHRIAISTDGSAQSTPHEISDPDLRPIALKLAKSNTFWVLYGTRSAHLDYRLVGFDESGQVRTDRIFSTAEPCFVTGMTVRGSAVIVQLEYPNSNRAELVEHEAVGNIINRVIFPNVVNSYASKKLIPLFGGIYDATRGNFIDAGGNKFGVPVGQRRGVLALGGSRFVGVGSSNGDASWSQYGLEGSTHLHPGFRDLQITPNPNFGTFRVEIPFHPATFRIVDPAGRVWRSGPVSAQTIFAPELPDGVYFLQVISGGQLESARFVVQRA